MIIWSRWGILLLPIVGLGLGVGALLGAIVSGISGADVTSVFLGPGLILGGFFVWLFDRYALPHLDRPRQQFVLQPLPQPFTHPNGVRQTHQQVPVVHPQTGQPLWVRPRSSLFFVPVRYWPFIVAGIGLVVTIGAAIGTLAG